MAGELDDVVREFLLEFVREVRASDGNHDVTMVMVTTETESEQVVRALAAGANE